MGRHSIDYHPETGELTPAAPETSIAPPGGPIDPGVPGAPDAPGPEAPSTVPVEPPPLAPEEFGDGSVTVPEGWQVGGPEFI